MVMMNTDTWDVILSRFSLPLIFIQLNSILIGLQILNFSSLLFEGRKDDLSGQMLLNNIKNENKKLQFSYTLDTLLKGK